MGIYHHTPRQVIRMALHHAIDDREAMIDAYRHPHKPNEFVDSNGYVEACQREVADFRLMLKRRYGEGA